MSKDRLLSGKGASTLSTNPLIGGFLLISLGLQGLAIFISLLVVGGLYSVSNKPNPAVIQLANGGSSQIGFYEGKDRPLPVVKQFALSTVSKLFNWSGTIKSLDLNVQDDPGVEIKGGGKIPTPVYEAGFALSEDFRPAFLTEIGKLVSEGKIFTKTSEVVFIPKVVTDPQPLGEGKWKVIIVGNRMVFDTVSNKLGEAMPFSKELYISAVPVPFIRAGTKDDISVKIARTRATGLEITGMKDWNAATSK
jgi:hypothetical protein